MFDDCGVDLFKVIHYPAEKLKRKIFLLVTDLLIFQDLVRKISDLFIAKIISIKQTTTAILA